MIARDTKPAVFLDRDGCLSPDRFGYISDPAGYSLYPYTGKALRILRDLGFQLFVVTNQSGIARGYFTLPQLEKVFDRMKSLLSQERVRLTGIYYSPYFKDGVVAPYNVDHEDRKPGLGMLKRARREHPFEAGRSWMIGDRYTDVEFGKKAGLKTILLLSGNGAKELLEGFADWRYQPDYIAENLLTAAKLISLLQR